MSVRLAQPLPNWKVKCAGRTLASKASGILTDVWIETYRLPPILEREPGRVRGLSGKQTVPLAACDSDSPRSAISAWSVSSHGRGSGSRQASKTCAVGFDSANWPPNYFLPDSLSGRHNYSGVGCWHPSCALNAAHAGPIPAA